MVLTDVRCAKRHLHVSVARCLLSKYGCVVFLGLWRNQNKAKEIFFTSSSQRNKTGKENAARLLCWLCWQRCLCRSIGWTEGRASFSPVDVSLTHCSAGTQAQFLFVIKEHERQAFLFPAHVRNTKAEKKTKYTLSTAFLVERKAINPLRLPSAAPLSVSAAIRTFPPLTQYSHKFCSKAHKWFC